MLTQEQASELRTKHMTKKVDKTQAKKIRTLDKALQELAFNVIGLDAKGKTVYYYNNPKKARHSEELWGEFDALNSDERQQIFAVFFPKMVGEVEQTWQFMMQMTYQNHYQRKAFRAPNNPEITLETRANWLKSTVRQIGMYHEDVVWFATYAAYLGGGYGGYSLSPLFAAVIDSGSDIGNTVFDLILASGRGEHDVAAMGHHVPRSLLLASRPDGWTFVENLLLAAQRQEGLRQSILEVVDECHPEAFKRMLTIIIDNNLTRFSSVVRAFDVWLGYQWDAASTKVINQTLEHLRELLSDEATRQVAIDRGEAEACYLALWAEAHHDIEIAVTQAKQHLDDADTERRYAAVHFLAQTMLREARISLLPLLADDDLRITARVAITMMYTDFSETNLFERIEALLPHLPDKAKVLDAIIWDWNSIELNPSGIATLLLNNIGKRDPKRLIPYLSYFEPYGRERVANILGKQKNWDEKTREALLKLLKDRSSYVRDSVLRVVDEQNYVFNDEEILKIEALLTRKSADLRRGVLKILVKQAPEMTISSAERLCNASKKPPRHAGLELLALLVEDNKEIEAVRALAQQYSEKHPNPDKNEETLLKRIQQTDEPIPTLDDALGLMNPDKRSPVPTLRKLDVSITTKAATAALLALDALIDEHRERPVSYTIYAGEREILLGNVQYHFPSPKPELEPIEDAEKHLPLVDLWREWYENRPTDQRDADGLELVRMWIILYHYEEKNVLRFLKQLIGGKPKMLKLTYRPILKSIIPWLLRLYPIESAVDFLLDTIEYRLSTYEPKYITEKNKGNYWHGEVGQMIDWRAHWSRSDFSSHIYMAREYYSHIKHGWNDAHIKRWWQLSRWIDEGTPELPRHRPPLQEVIEAHRIGAANDHDFYDLLLGKQDDSNRYYYRHFDALRTLSVRKFPKNLRWLADYAPAQQLYERARDRILEVEVQRGDLPTAASNPAMSLRTIPSAKWFAQILQALGNTTLLRGYIYGDGRAKNSVFSKLMKGSYPTDEDTVETFTETIKEANIKEKRLIEATVYAPQWAHLTEAVLGWDGFTDAVWWIHAHTKDLRWSVDQDVKQLWAAQVDERTPLSADDLQAGAVDVAWFKQVYHTLGEDRWSIIYEAAKFASSSGGHTRARIFADAMLGKLSYDDVLKRIESKRHQDSVRALGLLPIDEQERDAIILKRYQVLQKFLRGSRKFGSQRQESEKTAVRIAMENLARTAGYPDPQRLQWAMEAQEVADLREGPVVISVENITISLDIDGLGQPQVTIEKTDKKGKVRSLKNIPAKMKKRDDVTLLRERKKQIERQSSRMRRSLEEAMCRQDTFAVHELAELFEHPVLKPMLEALVFVGEVGIGYLVDGAVALEKHDLTQFELPSEAQLRIAHPYDLYQTREWHLWQQNCFFIERIQPFKQVFRELYVMTKAECDEPHISERYSGHQVQPRQALALLGSRGWVVRPDEGVQRTFHREGFSAFLSFMDGFYTPAQIEDLTISGVNFAQRGDWWKPIPLADVPAIIFSEVMRDLDLVVSVAHSGGVDPEATASTVEMRSALLRETLSLLKVDNVRLEKNHAFVDGKLGTYSVHLGSAMVHRQPGGALCIIPVHSQHRGRIFLPFADDDPRTAEVLSKVILLARDDQIKDPTILEQLIG